MFKRFLKKRTESKIFNDIISQSIQENYDVVIHIGSPKAGTSAIQKFLLGNRKSLEKEGYYYPPHPINKNGVSGGNSILAIAFLENKIDKAKEIYSQWENEAKSSNKTLLISSESFFNIANKFKEIFSNKKVLVIAYQRDIIEYLLSVHNQLIKRHFSTLTFEDYIDSLMDKKLQTANLVNKSFSTIYEEWTDLVGSENLIIRPYSSNTFFENKIEFDLLNLLNLNNQNFKLNKKLTNISYTESALELKRMINNILDPEKKELNNNIDMLLQEYSDKNSIKKEKTIPLNEEKLNKLKLYIQDDQKNINNFYLKNTFEEKKYFLKKNSYSFLELKTVLNYLLKDNKIKEYIYSETINKLKTRRNLTYSIYKLAELLDIEQLENYENISEDFWFTQNQLNNMAEGKYKVPDFLRDISVILKDKSDIINAKKIIDKAFELRPNGTFIKKFKEDLENK